MQIRVLLVDDDDLAAEAQRALLETDDRIQIVGRARNGREAIELSSQLDPDVVLMDIEMPVLDGVQATHQIRSRSGRSAVVAVSGSDYQERALEVRTAGAVDYVRKSRLDEELLDAVFRAAAGVGSGPP